MIGSYPNEEIVMIPNVAAPNKQLVKSQEIRDRYQKCQLSGELLKAPIAVCRRGFLFNKKKIVKALKTETLPTSFSYIKNVSHLKEIKYMKLSSHLSEYPISCSVSGKVLNGRNIFVCLWDCGCLINQRTLYMLSRISTSLNVISNQRRMKNTDNEFVDKKYFCPNCGTKFCLYKILKINNTFKVKQNEMPKIINQEDLIKKRSLEEFNEEEEKLITEKDI